MTDQPGPDRPYDPAAEAERQLRLAIAADARRERELRSRIRRGFYGCVTIVVVLFLVALLFF
jgi:hypothetical protein